MSNLPRVVRRDEGREIELPGEHFVGLLNGLDTDGRFAAAEYELASRYGTTEHRHHTAGEFFYVLAGPVTFDLDGVEHEVPEGSAVWVPPGV